MIKNFADKETEKIYNQIFSRKLPQDIQRIAHRKLIMMNNAACLEDLRIPPANHLEALRGRRTGQFSIRINGQYRICFSVEGNNYVDVEIVIIIKMSSDNDLEKGNIMADYIITPKISEILLEEFMVPMHLSAYRLAQEIHVPVSRIQDILHDRRKITPDTSLRLAKYFGVSDRYFLDIQNDIDIRELKIKLSTEIEAIKPCRAAVM